MYFNALHGPSNERTGWKKISTINDVLFEWNCLNLVDIFNHFYYNMVRLKAGKERKTVNHPTFLHEVCCNILIYQKKKIEEKSEISDY